MVMGFALFKSYHLRRRNSTSRRPKWAVFGWMCLDGGLDMAWGGFTGKAVMCGLGQSEKSWSNDVKWAMFSYFLMLIRSNHC